MPFDVRLVLRHLTCAAFAVCWLTTAAAQGAEPAVADLGSRVELFVDRHMIESLNGVQLTLHPPRPAEVALKTDAPWEGSSSAYFTVFQDGKRFRMYYRGSGNVDQEVTCYAESSDAIHWTKPELGLFEFRGSKKNNIVLVAKSNEGTHNFAPFKDTRPNVPADQLYKALGGGPLFAFVSADALHWKRLADKPVITKGAFDSQNIAFWDPLRGKYVSYYRVFIDGVRAISLATSDDFIHWTDPQPIDLSTAPREHLYTNATVPYFREPHYYLSFPKRFHPGKRVIAEHPNDGVSDGVFMSSRDGMHFDRTFTEAYIRPGRDRRNWGDRSNMTAWGILQTAPDEMSVFYSQNYYSTSHFLRRGVLRLDGIASVRATAAGELMTKPFTFRGKGLVLNYSTSAAGYVRVEIQEPSGKIIPGFALGDAPEVCGDEIAGTYRWKSGSDVSSLAGKPVRLRILLRDADLYSYRFVP